MTAFVGIKNFWNQRNIDKKRDATYEDVPIEEDQPATLQESPRSRFYTVLEKEGILTYDASARKHEGHPFETISLLGRGIVECVGLGFILRGRDSEDLGPLGRFICYWCWGE